MMGEIWVATKSIILFNKKALLIQRSSYIEEGANEWEFAGGGLQFGEGLTEGLLREVKEETGLSVRVDRLLYAMTRLLSPGRQIVGLTYLSYADTDAVVLSEEHRDYVWADREQFIKLLDKKIMGDLIAHSVMEGLDIR